MFGVDALHGFHILARANKQGGTRVQAFGLALQNTPPAVAGLASGLLRQKCQWRGFTHQAQLAVGFVGVRRVHIDAAINQCTVKIRHQRAHIP